MKSSHAPGFALLLLLTCAASLPADAPFGMAPQAPVFFFRDPDGTMTAAWQGVEGRTYFTEHSFNLAAWDYVPIIKSGTGQHEIGTSPSTAKCFVRLLFTDAPTADPLTADFDNDDLGNYAELLLGLNPLNPDSDADGIIDGVEVARSSNPLSDLDGDPWFAMDSDGDGLSNAVELARGTSPTLNDSDGDGYDDALDAYPLDPTRHSLTQTTGDATGPLVTLELPLNHTLVTGP